MAKHGKPLTEAELAQLVELKLDGADVRTIAKTLNCSTNTVKKYFDQWLDDTLPDRREFLERRRSEVIANLQQIAGKAAQGAANARSVDDMGAEVRYLAEARQAWRALSTVAGFDAPTKVQMASFDVMSEDEAQAALDKL